MPFRMASLLNGAKGFALWSAELFVCTDLLSETTMIAKHKKSRFFRFTAPRTVISIRLADIIHSDA